MLRLLLWIVLLAVPGVRECQARQPLAASAPARVAASAPAPPDYTARAIHDPNGTGKFYMGREIAKVMGHESAKWLERAQRERQEQVPRMLASLKIRPGNVVADIGAGSGYHTIRLARLVGPDGRVKAVDIQQEMLDLIRNARNARGCATSTWYSARPTTRTSPPSRWTWCSWWTFTTSSNGRSR